MYSGVVAYFVVIMLGGLTLGVGLALVRPQDSEAGVTYRHVARQTLERVRHAFGPKRFRRSTEVESRP